MGKGHNQLWHGGGIGQRQCNRGIKETAQISINAAAMQTRKSMVSSEVHKAIQILLFITTFITGRIKMKNKKKLSVTRRGTKRRCITGIKWVHRKAALIHKSLQLRILEEGSPVEHDYVAEIIVVKPIM
ncbi:hypothetical protein HPP92_000970 [Vanilla planifolia]|uniref:Uncharacterized protein n=1 Tax=Vanilla planifolia TaxID=51239 RepID=A0A835SBS2_VANPL|nr:hypothetical protein HPP92_000970 [Vanilla planifolia]